MSAPAPVTESYRVAGLELVSAWALPGLHRSEAGQADVEIVPGVVPLHIDRVLERTAACEIADDKVLFQVPGVGRVLIEPGTRVVVSAQSESCSGMRSLLLGPVLGAVLHLRGIVPLHAALVGSDSGCIALTGASGSGKSTLAAGLAGEGLQFISDEICAIDRQSRNGVFVHPGWPYAELWSDAGQAFGLDESAGERVIAGRGKWRHRVFDPGPFPAVLLRGLCEVVPVAPGARASLARVHRSAWLETGARAVYRARFAATAAQRAQLFLTVANLAATVPLYRLEVPRRMNVWREVADLLRGHT